MCRPRLPVSFLPVQVGIIFSRCGVGEEPIQKSIKTLVNKIFFFGTFFPRFTSLFLYSAFLLQNSFKTSPISQPAKLAILYKIAIDGFFIFPVRSRLIFDSETPTSLAISACVNPLRIKISCNFTGSPPLFRDNYIAVFAISQPSLEQIILVSEILPPHSTGPIIPLPKVRPLLSDSEGAFFY